MSEAHDTSPRVPLCPPLGSRHPCAGWSCSGAEGLAPHPSSLQPCCSADRRDLTGVRGSWEEYPEGAQWFHKLLAQILQRMRGPGYLCDLGTKCSRGRKRFSPIVLCLKTAVMCDAVAALSRNHCQSSGGAGRCCSSACAWARVPEQGRALEQ